MAVAKPKQCLVYRKLKKKNKSQNEEEAGEGVEVKEDGQEEK